MDNSYTVLPTSPSGYEDVIVDGEIIRVQSHISQWGKQQGGKDRVTNIVLVSVLIIKAYIFGLVICMVSGVELPIVQLIYAGFAIWTSFVLTVSLMWIRLRNVLAGLGIIATCCVVLVAFIVLLEWGFGQALV